MERQLFDYLKWDEGNDDNEFIYYDVILKQPIKDCPIGAKFHSAYLSYYYGTLVLRNDDIVVEVKLGLFVK